MRKSTSRDKNNSTTENKQKSSKKSNSHGQVASQLTSNPQAPSGLQHDIAYGGLSQSSFERHAGLLSDPHLSHPMYASQKAMIVQQLQRDYGNQYVQRLVNHIARKRAEGKEPGQISETAFIRDAHQSYTTPHQPQSEPNTPASQREPVQKRDLSYTSNSPVQRAWIVHPLDKKHARASDWQTATDVLRSGAKFTAGPGVALYRLAIADEVNFDLEFQAVNDGAGVGGTTDLQYGDGKSVIYRDILSNTVIMSDNIVAHAADKGLKILVKINLDSELNNTAGGMIYSAVHEFGVHAAEYYQAVKGLLLGEDVETREMAASGLAKVEGVGLPPKEKLVNALLGGHDVETAKAKEEHETLARGGSDYYKALVKTISDTELNTVYHAWMTSNRSDFMKAQEQDVELHKKAYDPEAFRKVIADALEVGIPLAELEEKTKALAESSKLFFREGK